ncbi:transposase [Sedimentisphaera salicampi]
MIEEAEVSGSKILKKAASRIRAWRNHILNWYEHKISNGKMKAAKI